MYTRSGVYLDPALKRSYTVHVMYPINLNLAILCCVKRPVRTYNVRTGVQTNTRQLARGWEISDGKEHFLLGSQTHKFWCFGPVGRKVSLHP